jgi:sialic acid synthase SpsE
MKAGDVLSPDNLRSVRPGFGLHTKYYDELLGRRVKYNVKMGTPMSWELVSSEE